MKTYAEALEGIDRALRGLSMPAPKRPELPSLDIDVDSEESTDKVHTSPARNRVPNSDEIPQAPAPVVVAQLVVDDIGVYRSAPAGSHARDDGGSERTRIDPRIAVPSADDVGLTLTPVKPKR